MDEQQQQIELCLNFQGQDYFVVVDAETASSLLNDQEAADQYVQALLLDESNGIENDGGHLKEIWRNKGKPSTEDEEATDLLLNLRQDMACKFDDKKTSKIHLWSIIAEDLRKSGFNIETGSKGAERCKQKFANMQKQYFQHVAHMNKTGEKKKDPPPYFEKMHSILGDKHKSNPVNLIDTEDLNSEVKHAVPSTSTDTKSSIVNRFKKSQETCRPPSMNSLLLQEMKKEHDSSSAHAAKMEELLQQQNQQREEFLKLFKSFVNKGSNKRKREVSNSDSE